MKVGLINPKGTIFSKNPRMKQFLESYASMGSFRHFWSAPNLGLLSIAAYLPKDWDVVYIDENYREIPFGESFDLICLSAMIVQATRAYEIARVFRENGAYVVMGGIHATVMPEEAALQVDTVIAGEGECLFPQFLMDFADGHPKKIYTKDEGPLSDMSKFLCPRYDLILDYDYPVINLYTMRGCPRKCRFCCASNVFGVEYKRKANHQILSEIDVITSLFPGTMLLFADDNGFVMRRESYALLESLREKRVRWIAQADISIADDDKLLKLLYEAGCQWLVIGFESVAPQNLAAMENTRFKQRYVDVYPEKIKKIQSNGLKIYGTFIVGLDEDDENVFEKTASFILDNHLYGANITVPTPLPSTAFREDMLLEGRILEAEWEEYTLWDVVVQPKHMSVRQLEDGLLSVYKTVSSPENAGKRLKHMLRSMRNYG